MLCRSTAPSLGPAILVYDLLLPHTSLTSPSILIGVRQDRKVKSRNLFNYSVVSGKSG